LLHVDKGAGVNKRVVGIGLSVGKSDTLVGIERASELISVDDAEDTSIKLNVDSNAEILPSVGLDAARFWYEVAFKEDTLWNARVLNTWLDDMKCSIL
jgi:hypothetical protein